MCPAHPLRLTYRLPAPGVEPAENTHLPTHAAETGARIALEHFKPLPFKIGRARLFPEKRTGAHDPGRLALALLLECDDYPESIPATLPKMAP